MNNSQLNALSKNDLVIPQMSLSIDEVIEQLEKIIQYSVIRNNCTGYFAVLYHKVTCKIKDCISKKDFEDCTRMEHLDVLFASRYLDAYYSWISGKQPTIS